MKISTNILIKSITDQHQLQMFLTTWSATRFAITDHNGIGIEEIHLPRIFEIFYRATDIKSGTGLGLYITKEIVEKLGGNIEAQSKFNVGTSFTLTIPNKITKLDIIAEQYA